MRDVKAAAPLVSCVARRGPLGAEAGIGISSFRWEPSGQRVAGRQHPEALDTLPFIGEGPGR